MTEILLLICRVPQGTCGLKSLLVEKYSVLIRRVPQGTCGLKSDTLQALAAARRSGPARDLWIEIIIEAHTETVDAVGSRKGPVD